MNKTIDLSQIIEEGMPVYPGTKTPLINSAANINKDGFRELELIMQNHVGTHIDTPAHIYADGKDITSFYVEKFTGKAIILPLSKEIPLTIENLEKKTEVLSSVDFILLNTTWDINWGKEAYYNNYPLPSGEVFEYLTNFSIKGIGIDAISVDLIDSIELPNHHILLSRDIIIIENLCNLSKVGDAVFDFFCFPLKINKGDGSPVRAVAQLSN